MHKPSPNCSVLHSEVYLVIQPSGVHMCLMAAHYSWPVFIQKSNCVHSVWSPHDPGHFPHYTLQTVHYSPLLSMYYIPILSSWVIFIAVLKQLKCLLLHHMHSYIKEALSMCVYYRQVKLFVHWFWFNCSYSGIAY